MSVKNDTPCATQKSLNKNGRYLQIIAILSNIKYNTFKSHFKEKADYDEKTELHSCLSLFTARLA